MIVGASRDMNGLSTGVFICPPQPNLSFRAPITMNRDSESEVSGTLFFEKSDRVLNLNVDVIFDLNLPTTVTGELNETKFSASEIRRNLSWGVGIPLSSSVSVSGWINSTYEGYNRSFNSNSKSCSTRLFKR